MSIFVASCGNQRAHELAGRDVHSLDDAEYYFNRELTWLNFNFRVLHEAERDDTPLLEQAKFLAIVSISLGVLNLLPIPVLDGRIFDVISSQR